MKRIILGIVMIALLLSACERDAASTDTAASPETVESVPYELQLNPEDRNQTLFGGIWSFVETPEGYYYGKKQNNPQGGGIMVYFCPRGGDTFYPLCGKPNCNHEDENCNAYLSDASVFGYYDGALFAAANGPDGKVNVVKFNIDGSNHQDVASVPSFEGGSGFAFHHGKLYLPFAGDSTLPLEMQEKHLIVLNLADYTWSDLVSDAMQASGLPVYSLRFCKDKMYGVAGVVGADGQYQTSTVEIDGVTGESRTLIPADAELFLDYYVTDSTLYYFCTDRDYNGEKFQDKVQPGFREYDLATGTVKDCGLPIDDANTAEMDGDYIYVTGFVHEKGKVQTLHVLAKDYTPVDQVDLDANLLLAAAASDRVFVADMRKGAIVGYLDKSQIGSHAMELKPIKTAE